MTNLPIYEVLEELKTTLQTNSKTILQAPPGAGKSTAVPISLLKESWLEDKMVRLLQNNCGARTPTRRCPYGCHTNGKTLG